MKPIDLDALGVYVPPCDRKLPRDEQTRFWFRRLTHSEHVAVRSAMRNAPKDALGIAYDLTRLVLVRAENFGDVDIEKTEGMTAWGSKALLVKSEACERIPYSVMEEIGVQALHDSELSEDDRGNS